MGLFNSGKNEKVEKVSKYERHYNVPQGSTRRRSSKHRSQHGEPSGRAMSQPPMMRGANGNMNGGQGFYQPPNVFNPAMVGTINPNMLPPNVLAAANIIPPNGLAPVRYPMPQFDLSKFAGNPFAGGQIAPMNLSPAWNNAMPLATNRAAFQPPLNEYQQAPWQPVASSNYGYMPPMQF